MRDIKLIVCSMLFVLGSSAANAAAPKAGTPALHQHLVSRYAAGASKGSPIVKGLSRGLLGIRELVVEHLARGDNEILMSKGGRLTLIPGKEGRFLVSESIGARLRNFEFAQSPAHELGVSQVEIMYGGSIFDPRSKLLRGAALSRYLTRIDPTAKP